MIYPRFLAQFWAWCCGYFWIPCPVCKEPFAGFECGPPMCAVVVKEMDGEHMYSTCCKPGCVAEGTRQSTAYFRRQGHFLAAPTAAPQPSSKE